MHRILRLFLILSFGTLAADQHIHRPNRTECESVDDTPCCHDGHYYRDCRRAKKWGCRGIWLPEDPVLFRPFAADPRQLTYSTGWRFNDNAIAKNVIAVSFADSFPLYCFCNALPWGGPLKIEIEGGLWGVFDPLHEDSPLVNADYYVGIPITYAICGWQFRLRLSHISSHIGDEYLIVHPDFDRKNPSYEFVDFYVSHDMTEEIRLYGGVGHVLRQDEDFRCGEYYTEAGMELRMYRLGFVACKQQIYGTPIFAMHFKYQDHYDKHIDQTYILGYEFGKTTGLCRRMRVFMEYHDGYSPDGQFCVLPSNYLTLRLSYGY